MKVCFHQSEQLGSRIQMIAHADEDVEQGKHSSIADRDSNLYSNMEINMKVPQKDGINLPKDPAISLLGIYERVLHPGTGTPA